MTLVRKNKGSEGLKTNFPRIPKFYTQPKTHISSLNCLTFKISENVDYHLQPIIKQILSYVKD